MSSDLNEITKQQSGLIKAGSGLVFRDLNKNGRLDIFEDSRQPLKARVEDLLSQMSLEEKAGMLFINGTAVNADGSIDEKPNAQGFGRVAVNQITEQKMNHFNLWQIPNAPATARWHNNLQPPH